MALPWFRMYAEAVDDEKLRLLAFEDRWHFVAILCCKCQGVFDCEDPGLLRRKLAVKLGVDLSTLDEIRRRLVELDLIDEGFEPTNWDSRQFVSDHDPTNADRQRRYRERHRNALRNGRVTRTEQNRADTEQSRAEGEGSRFARPADSLEADREAMTLEAVDGLRPAERKPAKRRTACRLPEDFELTDERRIVAEAEKLPAERTFAKFVDYWRSASGSKARKHDWDATWRNWCRSEADYRSRGANGSQGPRKTRFAQLTEGLDGDD